MKLSGLLSSLLACTFYLPFSAQAKPVKDVTVVDRPWVSEGEFQRDNGLHARRGQTVLLHLEDSARGAGAQSRSSSRLLVEQAQYYSFCLPEEEPHIVRLKLKRSGGRTLINGRRAVDCKPVLLEPGSYELHVWHTSSTVPEGGTLAFLHQDTETLGIGTAVPEDVPEYDFMAFRGENGKFVTDNTNSLKQMAPKAATVGLNEVWRIQPENSTKFKLQNGDSLYPRFCDGTLNNQTQWPLFTTNPSGAPCPSGDPGTVVSSFRMFRGALTDEFQLNSVYTAQGTWLGGPVILTSDEFMVWGPEADVPDSFTVDYQGHECATACDDTTLPLTQGQIALYSQCDYQGPAIVFTADKADLSIYDAAAPDLAIGRDMARSLRVGPDTIVDLYAAANHAGDPLTTASDIPCMDATALGNDTLDSFKILRTGVVPYIISSTGCKNCILTEIDLSNQDFSGLDFTGSVFTGSNFTDTDFTGADLTKASFPGAGTTLSGTVFSMANLACTSFWSASVSGADFTDVVLPQDYSCYLDLEAASIDFSNFPPDVWRFLDLTGSSMSGLPDTLSSAETPLDLSGSILTSVQWLAGKTLDFANFGCYGSQQDQMATCPESSGQSVCATLQGTVLSDASLRFACLSSASMEGAVLGFANLDGANMDSVQLGPMSSGGKAATLEGAFMRNVILSSANLTGVDAQNSSFYSTSTSTLLPANGLTAPGVNFSGAYLAYVDFSGSGSKSILQGSNWSNAMLLGSNFTQTDLSPDSSGGVSSGISTTFEGAYMQGVTMDGTTAIGNVNFLNTYWDAMSSGGSLNLQIPARSNLQFTGYWKDISLPECPPPLKWAAGLMPPLVTDASNTCPNDLPGPCDGAWGDPKVAISEAFFPSAVPPEFPQDPTVSAELQCSTVSGAMNRVDYCWTESSKSPPAICLPGQ